MREIIKKYIKPILEMVGLYNLIYSIYTYFSKSNIKIVNRFVKIFYKTSPILLYHRIATVSTDPLMLCVSEKCFEQHLIFLKKNYGIIHLSELSRRLLNNTLTGNEAAITFDDGYRDNLTNALPLLEKYNVPATIFITTSLLGKSASFDWDMQYKQEDRATFLNSNEIKILKDHPLIEIGAHTHNHPRLSDLDEQRQKDNILKSKEIIEQAIEGKIKAFAYPFGGPLDFNWISEKVVKETGFEFAYSNTGLLAKGTKKRYSIPRINIREYSISKLAQSLLS